MLRLKMMIENTETNHIAKLEEQTDTFYELGQTDYVVIGDFIHHALAAAGYPVEGNTILLQGVTYEEAEMLEDYLEDIRANRKEDE